MGQWFRGIGTARRAVVIVSFAVAVFVCVHAVQDGGIDGWTTGRAD